MSRDGLASWECAANKSEYEVEWYGAKLPAVSTGTRVIPLNPGKTIFNLNAAFDHSELSVRRVPHEKQLA